jgi:hypothetical protein
VQCCLVVCADFVILHRYLFVLALADFEDSPTFLEQGTRYLEAQRLIRRDIGRSGGGTVQSQPDTEPAEPSAKAHGRSKAACTVVLWNVIDERLAALVVVHADGKPHLLADVVTVVHGQCAEWMLRELAGSIVGIVVPIEPSSGVQVDPRHTFILSDGQIQQRCERPAISSDIHQGIAIVRAQRRGDRQMKARERLRDDASKLIDTQRRSAEKIYMEGEARVGESRCL